ncbi:AsnC family transcriptional regulator [Halalkalicoccus salilacus]|uniref:AsnC family transcriptional regulator n=1 Tax=Halalkalicoccus salilacus TaxID=3117459 RepID=UPI00300EF259
MVELDDTDAEILQLLLEDGRRSYTDIGERVGLSSPSVSNRVERLEELGVIEGFTVNVDRSILTAGDAVLIEIETRPGETDRVVESLAEVDSVESVLQSVDTRVSVYAYMNDRELDRLFSEVLDARRLEGYEVRKIANSIWNPKVGGSDLAIECVECGRAIHDDGVTVEVGEERYYLCCTSCESLFRERYRELEDGIEE